MLKCRILTALVLLPLILAALFLLSPVFWAVFAGLICGVALWEFARIAGFSPSNRGFYLGLTALAALAAWRYGVSWPKPLHALVLVFWLILVPVWFLRGWKMPKGLLAALLGWWLIFPAWFAMLDWRVVADKAYERQLLIIMGLVWVADVAAYFTGKALGKHKLAPTISPGKSWEGVIGALLAVTLYTGGVSKMGWLLLPPLAVWQWMLLAWLLTMVSVSGDLLESWFKRCAGMKDSSALLPGHGGVYDRIDSLVAVLAVSNALRVLAGW